MHLLEGSAIETIGQHRSPADDVGADFHLFGVVVQHLFLDAVAESLGLSLSLSDDVLPLGQSLYFCNQFVLRHNVVLLFC